MGLKEKHRLTQAAVQAIIEGVTSLHKEQLDSLRTQVCATLCEACIVPTSVPGLDGLFKNGESGHLFQDLKIQYQQLKFYKTHFSFIVSTEICMYMWN